MTQITVPHELARLIAGASPPIVIVDPNGRKLGQIAPLTSSTTDEVALALQRMEDAKLGGNFYTTKEVLEHLQASE